MRQPYSHLLIGCLLCLLTGIFGMRGAIRSVRMQMIRQIDSRMEVAQANLDSLFEMMTGSTASLDRVDKIESHNRSLAVALTNCALPTVENTSTTESVKTTLSLSHGTWIVLAGYNDGLSEGDAVLNDSVFLGKIATVYSSYSTLKLILADFGTQVFEHVGSQQSGLLRIDEQGASVTFTKKIDTLHEDDILATIPDGAHTRRAYPVVKIVHIDSLPTDSVSKVSIAPLTQPGIGKTIVVLKSKK